ncbi:MAG TPA: hypothetical protein DCZ72_15010 [Armatimonadetes bacterium]|nr:hypothetical protein [Armatimonadota bacterium]
MIVLLGLLTVLSPAPAAALVEAVGGPPTAVVQTTQPADRSAEPTSAERAAPRSRYWQSLAGAADGAVRVRLAQQAGDWPVRLDIAAFLARFQRPPNA